ARSRSARSTARLTPTRFTTQRGRPRRAPAPTYYSCAVSHSTPRPARPRRSFRRRMARGGPSPPEERKLGRLRVLLVRMNPDLTMGADLLKKTGAGNLFMVFGEPDVEISRVEDGQVQVEIRGVDVYDPTTGQVRSSTTDDV